MRSLALLLALSSSVAFAEPLSPERAREFGLRIEQSLNARDATPLDAAMDLDEMLRRAVEDLDVSKTTKEAFGKGVKGSMKFAANLVKEMGPEEGKAKFLRLGKRGKETTAMLRVQLPSGVNYLELELAAKGQVTRIVDLFVFLSGTWMSETLRQGFIPVVAHEKRGILDRIAGKTSDYIKHVSDIAAMAQHVQAGQAAEAMAVYKKLPPAVQRERQLLLLRFQAATALGDEEYLAAMTAIEKTFPNDPAFNFVLIDKHFMRNDFDKAIASVKHAESAIGEDAYLIFLRGNVIFAKKDYPAAKKELWRAIGVEPTLVDPYWTLLTIALEQKEWAEARKILLLVETKVGVAMSDLQGVPEYEGFVKSPEYKKWLKERPKAE